MSVNIVFSYINACVLMLSGENLIESVPTNYPNVLGYYTILILCLVFPFSMYFQDCFLLKYCLFWGIQLIYSFAR